MRYLAFRTLFTTLIKAELRRVFMVTFEKNIFFSPKATHSLAMLMTLSAIKSLLTSEFMISFVLKCKTAISGITSVSFKVGRIQSQPAFTCSKLTIETLEQGVKYVQS